MTTRNNVKLEVGAIIRIKGTPPHGHSIWKVTGIHLGATLSEALVSISRLDLNPGAAFGKIQEDSIVPMVILDTHAGVENP